MKLLDTEFKKENISKNITGLKLMNNKLLNKERVKYFENYSENFKNNIERYIEVFNGIKTKEYEYSKRWNEIIEGLKNSI